jgi:hypothetical protein
MPAAVRKTLFRSRMTMRTEEREEKLRELAELRRRVAELEREMAAPPEHWEATSYYAAYYATTGFMLGMFGAVTSLVFNIVGSTIVGQHPLKLIQVYLTFPLGERALGEEFDSGIALAIGCCLYLGTGMLLGIPFQMAMARFLPHGGLLQRLVLATLLGLLLWIINFYGVLSWLQPLLFGGNWILEQIPMPVAALTHLVFAWTMALVYPLGEYIPYRRQTEVP